MSSSIEGELREIKDGYKMMFKEEETRVKATLTVLDERFGPFDPDAYAPPGPDVFRPMVEEIECEWKLVLKMTKTGKMRSDSLALVASNGEEVGHVVKEGRFFHASIYGNMYEDVSLPVIHAVGGVPDVPDALYQMFISLA